VLKFCFHRWQEVAWERFELSTEGPKPSMLDHYTVGAVPATVIADTGQSLAISLSMIAVSWSAGVLIGVVSPSVLVGANSSSTEETKSP
jgi:hypothetical protein